MVWPVSVAVSQCGRYHLGKWAVDRLRPASPKLPLSLVLELATCFRFSSAQGAPQSHKSSNTVPRPYEGSEVK